MKIKNFVVIVAFLCSLHLFSQAEMKLTKENICKGAAISVVANVKPMMDAGMSKAEILQFGKELVKDVIKGAPEKAYDLFKENKTKDQVKEILYKDFMKLDEKTVFKLLLKADPYEDEEYEEDDED
jgi:hypothetical protein